MPASKNIFISTAIWLAAISAQAQNTAPATKTAFKLFFEKVYLHTDRDVYTTGDTLWFKAYLTDAQNNKPITTSNTLYVDLIAPDAHVVSTDIVRLNDSYGHADFDLADTLAAGKYHLRAYTNWMKNFGDAFIYEKEITIASLARTATQPIVKGNNTTPKQKKPELVIAIPAPAMPIVRFFPEGGSMVEGISSIVAVKAEDANGKGIPATGAVLSASNDTISRFKCDSLGMGLFAFLPFKGQQYHAMVNIGRKTIPLILPAALKQGLALQVKQGDGTLHVVVSNTNPADSANKAQYTLAVKHSGHSILAQQIQAAGRQIQARIPTNDLPEGIAAITLYDAQGHPNCERLVYIHHADLNTANLTTDKKAYAPFEKTTVQINSGPGYGNLSMAVVDAGVVPKQADDIVSYLMLGSELHGRVEQARHYFDTANPNRFKQLDLLLLTQGWRDFIWRKLADTAINISYANESGINVAGFVKDEVNHKAMPGLNVTLFASGAEGTKLLATHSDNKGHFVFPDMALYGNQGIKLSAVNSKGDTKGSFEVDTFFTLPVKPIIKQRVDDAADTALILATAMVQKANMANKLKGITNLREVKITANKNFVTLPNGRKAMTWGTPQAFNITPKDYEYKTLSWFLQQKDKKAVLNDANKPGVAYIIDGHKVQPHLIVNGSSFHIDKERYFNMPIEKFKHIDVYPLLGGYVISVVTKQADPLIDNPGYLTLDVQGYYSARTFYKPIYEGEATPPKTDLRTTIHWQPYIKTDINGHATVSYYNTSGSTTARIIVQGIKADGTPISQLLNYEVK